MLKIIDVQLWDGIWFVYFNRSLCQSDFDNDETLKSIANRRIDWLLITINNKEHVTYLMLKYA